MKEKFLKWSGLERKTPFVRDFFFAANIRASVYMCVLIILLESWMIIRLLSRQLSGIDIRTTEYYISHYLDYGLLLTSGALMLIYDIRYLTGRKCRKWLGYVLMWALVLITLYFGVQISVSDYSKGEQVFTFLTMELFGACLLTWPPVVSLVLVSGSYLILYICMNATTVATTGITGATAATQINIFIMWIATICCSFSNYNRISQQAYKAENLVSVNEHLSKISVEDELTGIHNMVYFRSEAEKLMNYVTTDKENILFLFFDIENFKSYNETYGFKKGNELLIKAAKMFDEQFKGSLVSRFSDDHFVVLTRNEDISPMIAKISAEIKKDQGDVQLQLKCGAYRPEAGESDPSLACDRARFACSSIKKHYNLNYRLYDKQLEDKYRLRNYIVNNIDSAIENGHIKVFYQPIISSEDGCVRDLEALARWIDPEHGMLNPGVFIEVLEEHHQIHKLDRCIIEQVCMDCRRSLDEHGSCIPVSINLSRLDFELCDIVGILCETLDKYHLEKKYIDVEVTESALTGKSDLLSSSVSKLRSLGFKVWLDDFGSGYSSLNVLKDYQFDVLKIDMQFLRGYPDNRKSEPILENIVSLSRQLNMVSLTEGVETEVQREFLKNIGCDLLQGYLFSKPIPIETLREKLSSGELKALGV